MFFRASQISSLLFAILFLGVRSDAQNSVTDSLLQEAVTAKEDTVKANNYRKLAFMLAENLPDSALVLARKALNIAITTGQPLLIANCQQSMGVTYDYLGNLDSCVAYLKMGIASAARISRPDIQSHQLSDLAIAYYYRGIYELALRSHMQALALRQQFGDSNFIARSLNNIGLVYKARKDYSNAIRFYQQSLAIKQVQDDKAGIFNTLLNIGSLYQAQKIFDSAATYAFRALDVARHLNAIEDIAAAQGNVGVALLNQGRTAEAKEYLNPALKWALENQHRNILYSCYEGLGDIEMSQNNYTGALTYYREGLKLAEAGKRRETMLVFFKHLSIVYEKQGDIHQALLFQKKSIALSDSLLNEENIRQINEMTALYETEEKEKAIVDLTTEMNSASVEARLNKNQRNIFISSSILLLGLLSVVYYLFRKYREQKRELEIKNKEIEKQLRENELLMKEIHHRVKNNLQTISSLLSLQSHYIKDTAALEAVRESKNRVQSMALIHKNLYSEENLTSINVKQYMESLCEHLFQSYNLHQGNISLEMEIEPNWMDVEILVPIGLMLNELITNSMKHAFVRNDQGRIKVILKQQEQNLFLAVYDNGVGLTQGEEGDTENTKSFGTKLLSLFTKKLKARMRRYNDDGARVEITIPNVEMK
jgi:two-component system, sensor histidine kinase PdtaS